MSQTPSPSASLPTDAGALARLQTVIDLLPVPVAVFDTALRLVQSNPAFNRVAGLSEPPRPGTHAREAFPAALDDISALLTDALNAASASARVGFMADGSARLMDVTLTSLSQAPSHAGAGGVLLVARDVTDHEQAIIHDVRARERRLAAVGQLAAGVMHDVNNALNPIVAAAYLLDVHAEDADAVRDYARRIAMAAETGAATAARVGRFIRQEPLQGSSEELVELDVVADEVLAMTRPVWSERVQSGGVDLVRTRDDAALVRGIPGEIREALLNLVQNALDAMSSGGTLGVVTGSTADSAWIEVRDSGRGMSAEARERAFEPFYSTKGRKGTGLGLAEVYGIMKRHRGAAEITSSSIAGTTVRLTFPRATTTPGPRRAPQQARVQRRVLVVEDHEDGREFMRALLVSDGHDVEIAGGVAEALAILRQTAEPFDLLLADLGLPDGSGWDLVREAHKMQRSLRVGVVTGWEPAGEPPVPVEFTLRKPVPAQALLRLVAGDSVAPQSRA